MESLLNDDYKDILSAFANAEVEYLLVGAYALAAHGHPRSTGDIDLWVRPTLENAERVIKALRQFGAPTQNISRSDFSKPQMILQIGVSPRRIDIITDIEAVTFHDAWPNRLQITVYGMSVPVIGKDDLIRNKEATGRKKDEADVEELREASSE